MILITMWSIRTLAKTQLRRIPGFPVLDRNLVYMTSGENSMKNNAKDLISCIWAFPQRFSVRFGSRKQYKGRFPEFHFWEAIWSEIDEQ